MRAASRAFERAALACVNNQLPGSAVIEHTERFADPQLEALLRGIVKRLMSKSWDCHVLVLCCAVLSAATAGNYSFFSSGRVWENRRASSACSHHAGSAGLPRNML